MPNALPYYPKLSDLITLDKIPESLSFMQNISQQLFSKIYYKDYQISISPLGESGLYDKWANKYGNEIAKNLMEKAAAEELIQKASEWKLPKEEIELIKQRLEFFIEELKILGYEN